MLDPSRQVQQVLHDTDVSWVPRVDLVLLHVEVR